ncbi:MAG: GNAT family N-acetyltransferase [Saprospiraceae bacterium]|nr:GNAT family N-acetyltransferase [Saprospiraceae bacterium]
MAEAGDIRFLQLGPDQANELRSISLDTFSQSFFHLNTRENFEAYVSDAFDEEKLKNELSLPDSRFYFVFFLSRLAGYFKINFHAGPDPQSNNNALELQRIYLLSPFQGYGLGNKILDFIVQLAQSSHHSSIWLGVWEHNTKAIRFYEKNGFIRKGEHAFLLGQDPQTDYIYSLDL